MFLIWQRNCFGGFVPYKCNEIPSNGHGKAAPYVTKRELTAEESALPLRMLERLYPAPTDG